MRLPCFGERKAPAGLEASAFPPCATLFGCATTNGPVSSPAIRRAHNAVSIGPVLYDTGIAIPCNHSFKQFDDDSAAPRRTAFAQARTHAIKSRAEPE